MQNRKIKLLTGYGHLPSFKDKSKELSLQEYLNMSLQGYKEYLFKNGALRYIPEKLSEYICENESSGYEYTAYADIVLELKTGDYEPERDIIEHLFWWDNEINDVIHSYTIYRMITEEEDRINEANGEYDDIDDEELNEPDVINEYFDMNRPERKIKLFKIDEFQELDVNNEIINVIEYGFEYV